MTDLSNLGRPDGAHRSRKRLGRGPGSGLGKTAGKGHKGQKARTGGTVPAWFEGGQMPLQRRIPKRGFKNPFRRTYQIVNIAAIADISEKEVTPEILAVHGLVDAGSDQPIKVLGEGEIKRKVVVHAHAFSAGAQSKIEAAGGRIERIQPSGNAPDAGEAAETGSGSDAATEE